MASRRTVKDVLLAALSKLQVCGWQQNASGNRKHGYCMTGAVNASTKSEILRLGAYDALDAVVTKRDEPLIRQSSYPVTRVQLFNDRDSRRKQTILAIYRRAIKRAA